MGAGHSSSVNGGYKGGSRATSRSRTRMLKKTEPNKHRGYDMRSEAATKDTDTPTKATASSAAAAVASNAEAPAKKSHFASSSTQHTAPREVESSGTLNTHAMRGEEGGKKITLVSKPCVAMTFDLIKDFPYEDIKMLRDASTYSTSSYVSLTDSFELHSYSEEEVLFPLARNFDEIGVNREDYGQAIYFNHVPDARPSSRLANIDIFRGLKPIAAMKQQNAQLKKIKQAKDVAEGVVAEGLAVDKQFQLKIKGFAKSLPKTIEGGKIVSEAGWRENLKRKKKREAEEAAARRAALGGDPMRSATPNPRHNRPTTPGFRPTTPSAAALSTRAQSWGTQKTGTHTSKSSGDTTLKTVLNMLSCIEKTKNPDAAVGSASLDTNKEIKDTNKEIKDVFRFENLRAVTNCAKS